MKKFLPHIALGLFVAQLLLMLVSWIYSAALPMSGVRSLLSGEGLRWLMGHYADVLATPWLVWLLLWAMAWGVLRRSGLLAWRRGYREKQARWITLLLLLVLVAAELLLTMTPQAVLLSVTGHLWPSPFSQSLVPFTAFSVLVLGVCYGMLAGPLSSLRQVYEAILDGLRAAAPLVLFYVLLMQLYASLRFVLG